MQPGLEDCIAGGTCNPIPKVNFHQRPQTWGAPPTPFYVHIPIRGNRDDRALLRDGSHAIKGGLELSTARASSNGDSRIRTSFYQRYRTVNGVTAPFQVTLFNTPTDECDNQCRILVCTPGHLDVEKAEALTPGIRWGVFQRQLPRGRCLGQQQALMITEGYTQRPLFPATTMPTFSNWAPLRRLLRHLFGNGKTAIKASVAK